VQINVFVLVLSRLHSANFYNQSTTYVQQTNVNANNNVNIFDYILDTNAKRSINQSKKHAITVVITRKINFMIPPIAIYQTIARSVICHTGALLLRLNWMPIDRYTCVIKWYLLDRVQDPFRKTTYGWKLQPKHAVANWCCHLATNNEAIALTVKLF